MATKKQKRARGELRQAANREESRQIGLQAQKRDRERREKAKKAAAKKAAEEKAAKEKAKNMAQTPSVMAKMAAAGQKAS